MLIKKIKRLIKKVNWKKLKKFLRKILLFFVMLIGFLFSFGGFIKMRYDYEPAGGWTGLLITILGSFIIIFSIFYYVHKEEKGKQKYKNI